MLSVSTSVRAVQRAVHDFLVSVDKAPLAAEEAEIFAWITVHDASTSYHGRHYHRNQAMTAVLYLEVSETSVRFSYSYLSYAC